MFEKSDFNCLGENSMKGMYFSVSMDKDEVKKNFKFRFISTSPLNLTENLIEKLHQKKCRS